MLEYNDNRHEYKENGLILPSVTQIIKDAGLINFDWIDKDLLEAKADLGNKVHTTTELYDTDSLVVEDLHPTLNNYLQQWIKFRKDFNFIISDIELQLSHELYRFAGRIDRVGLFNNKDVTVLDIKTGVEQKTNGLQLAGYELLYNQGKKKNEQIKKRICVYLTEESYNVVEYKDVNDKNVFLAALTISNFKRRK